MATIAWIGLGHMGGPMSGNLVAARQRREHRIGSGHRLGDRVDDLHPVLGRGSATRRVRVDPAHVVPRSDEIARHRAAHVTQTDPGDGRHGPSRRRRREVRASPERACGSTIRSRHPAGNEPGGRRAAYAMPSAVCSRSDFGRSRCVAMAVPAAPQTIAMASTSTSVNVSASTSHPKIAAITGPKLVMIA